MRRGGAYLAAVLDWAGRKALSWRLSNALDASFRSEAPKKAISRHKAPEIFDTEKGSRFTSDGFTGVLKARDIRTSGDGRGRFLDNVFVERRMKRVARN